jgi:hypothetical protein
MVLVHRYRFASTNVTPSPGKAIQISHLAKDIWVTKSLEATHKKETPAVLQWLRRWRGRDEQQL